MVQPTTDGGPTVAFLIRRPKRIHRGDGKRVAEPVAQVHQAAGGCRGQPAAVISIAATLPSAALTTRSTSVESIDPRWSPALVERIPRSVQSQCGCPGPLGPINQCRWVVAVQLG